MLANAKDSRSGIYINPQYAVASTSSSSPYWDAMDSTGASLEIGYRMESGLGIDLLTKRHKFGPKKTTTSVLGTDLDVTTELDVTSIGGVLRYFIGDFISIKGGFSYNMLDAKVSLSVAGANVTVAGVSDGIGLVAGGGLSIPIGPFDLTVDGAIVTLGDVSFLEYSGGLRLYF